MLENKAIVDLQKIVSAGGGLDLDASAKATIDLQKIASAAKSGSAFVIMRGMGSRATIDLQKIGAAGGGKVIFAEWKPC